MEADIINKRKKLIRNIGIIFIIGIVLITFSSKTINNFLMPEVEFYTFSAGAIYDEIKCTGEVSSENTEYVYSPGSWVITEVKAKDGMRVAEGEPLAAVDSDEILSDIKSMELVLMKLENDFESYKEGYQAVDLDTYSEEIELSKKAIDKAAIVLRNNKELYDSGAISLDEYNNSLELLEAAQRDYDIKQKLYKTKESQTKQNDARYQRTLKEKSLEIEQKRLEIKKLKSSIPKAGNIVSPVYGMVRNVYIKRGLITNKNQLLFEITPLDSGAIVWKLGIKSSKGIEIGSPVDYVVSTAEGNQPFKGAVEEKIYIPSEDAYEFTDYMPQIKDNLEIGQKVDISIPIKGKEYPYVVPNSCIVNEGNNTYVFALKYKDEILGEQAYAKKIPVEILEEGDLYTGISAGFAADERIIYYTTKALYDGSQVRVR